MNASLFLAKFLGLYLVIISLLWLVRYKSFEATVQGMIGNPVMLFFAGFLSLVMGLAIVLTHNVWTADWRVILTLVGYAALVKGILLLGWPGSMERMTRVLMRRPVAVVYAVVLVPLGSWLAWTGFQGG